MVHHLYGDEQPESHIQRFKRAGKANCSLIINNYGYRLVVHLQRHSFPILPKIGKVNHH